MIRPIKREDALAIVELARRMQQESPAYSPYPFSSEKLLGWVELCLTNPDWRCLIAYDDGQPVGFFACGLVDMLFCDEKTVDDLALYVVPEKRGSMIGPKMLKNMTSWARGAGAREMRVGVTTEIANDRVGKLLECFDFYQGGVLMKKKF